MNGGRGVIWCFQGSAKNEGKTNYLGVLREFTHVKDEEAVLIVTRVVETEEMGLDPKPYVVKCPLSQIMLHFIREVDAELRIIGECTIQSLYPGHVVVRNTTAIKKVHFTP